MPPRTFADQLKHAKYSGKNGKNETINQYLDFGAHGIEVKMIKNDDGRCWEPPTIIQHVPNNLIHDSLFDFHAWGIFLTWSTNFNSVNNHGVTMHRKFIDHGWYSRYPFSLIDYYHGLWISYGWWICFPLINHQFISETIPWMINDSCWNTYGCYWMIAISKVIMIHQPFSGVEQRGELSRLAMIDSLW